LLLSILPLGVSAQAKDSVATKVYLESADSLTFNRKANPDAQILRGNVSFRHDSAYMYCDSAYFYELTNSLEAFSNVRMEQGDTLFIYGDYLYYDGNAQMALLRENVRMENNQVILFTDSLNYDRVADMGYYFEGGLIVDEENELSSFYGQYSPGTKLAVFNDSVQLYNPGYTLYSDTLHYLTDTKVATILGPSIIESDSGTIHTTRGWYDTENNKSLLLDRSRIVTQGRLLTGDSIFYDKAAGFGEVFGNMFMQDTAQSVILEGQYGYYNEKTEFAFATDSARILYYVEDTLFVHGDTLQMITIDSAYREIKAYHGIRFYRTDIQGVCDSMLFNTKDSLLCMYDDPVLWNEEYQITGDTILMFMNDSTIEYAYVKQYAFAIQNLDTTYYNQLKGTDIKAYFAGKAIHRIDVEGNAESIFYPIETDGTMIGMNETKSGYLSIWVDGNKLERLKLWPAPKAVTTPLPDLAPEQQKLKDFQWLDYLRPQSKDDIYTVVKRKAEEEAPKRSNKFIRRQ
jgi:lipopolysaccharide export system protein LptA